jgi:DNA invertase Pin-like site-specific DNA recombinase
MNKKALALLRVSTDSQDVQRQRTDLRKLQKQYSLDIVRTLELVGVSGTATLTNAEVQRVLDEVTQDGIDGLACSAIDRLARPKRGSDFAIATAFEVGKKTIWTVRDGSVEMWTDAGWEKFMTSLTRAGSEWREIRRRSLDGKAEKRLQGLHPNGQISLPQGLRFNKRTGWSYDEQELAKVTKAYELLFEDRYPLSEIERLVGWSRRRIRTLMNPTWRGVRAYPATAEREAFEVPLPLEPVLTPERWGLAQTLLAKRRTWSRETREQRHLGAGLLVCQCGRHYYIHCDVRKGQHDGYLCSSRHPRGIGCGAPYLWRETVDAAIFVILEKYLTDPKFVAAGFRRLKETRQPDNTVKREAELSRLRAKRTRLLDALEDGLLDKAEFAIRAEKIQTAMRQIEATMPVAPSLEIDTERAVAGLVRHAGRFRTKPFDEQRRDLKDFVRYFEVADGCFTQVALSGAYLGELSHTKPGQHLILLCWRRCTAPESQ